MTRFFGAILILTLMFGLVVVAWPTQAAVPIRTSVADVKAVARGNAAFACDLYARLKTRAKGNLFFSPYSVSTALAMTYAGAAGNTAAQMKKVLRFNLPPERLHPAFGALQRVVGRGQKKSYWQLVVANALWPQKGYSFTPSFVKMVKDYYASGLRPLDYQKSPERARRNINHWVAKKTNNKIKNLLARGMVSRMTRLVLTNAIYFKARWLRKFHKSQTKPMDFRLSPKKKVKVKMMFQKDEFGYAEVDGLQVLEMPYYGWGLSMVVLLPKEIDGLGTLENNLTPANLVKWLAAVKWRQVKVYMPKFKFSSRFGLKETLSAMGMGVAFTNGADFSKMTIREKLVISAVIHQAYVAVDEMGTEAAAATAVAMAGAAAPGPPPPPPPAFKADHPFLFFIRDRRTGGVLFIGRVVNPRKNR